MYLPPIYPITDTSLAGISHLEQTVRLVAGGSRFVQLREKNATPRDFYSVAESVVRIARKSGVRIIINDRVDIALAIKADGVHLGQHDLPPEHARKMLGPEAIIGFSTHSLEQAQHAMQLPVDYIAIGPIFPTSTKADPDAVVGLQGLAEVRDLIGSFPLVAIGGINEENLGSVFAAGADSAAVIGSILSNPKDISGQYARLVRISVQDSDRESMDI